MESRRAYVKITYNSKDITKDIAPYLESFVFNDNSEDKVDDINITLEDRDGKWANDWFPAKGDNIQCTIVVAHWQKEKDNRSLPCGNFEVDEITLSGVPRKLEIKAVSVPGNGVKNEKRSKAWNKVTLKQIATGIATNAKLELFYDALVINYDRRDQVDQSDLAFLRSLCKDAGLSLKITNSQLVIFEQKKYEDTEPVMTIKYDEIKSYSLTTQSHEYYTSAKLIYHHPEFKKDTNFDYTLKTTSKGKQLIIHRRASSKAEAEQIARSELRAANKGEYKANISMIGDPQVQAGVTVNLSGFGVFDGKYFVDSVRHDLTDGYNSTLVLHKVLGY